MVIFSQARQRELRESHLLLLPDTVAAQTVDKLVRQRVDDSRLLELGSARLGRRSAITGPVHLDDATAAAVLVPRPWSLVYALEAPVERDPAAFGDIADPVQRAWWMRLFPNGKPFREEGEAVDLALALARRLGGALRVSRRSVVVRPDPDRLVDLTVWSPFWLGTKRLLDVVAHVLPGADVDLGGAPWHGPTDEDPEPWSLHPHDDVALDVVHALDDELRTAAAAVGATNDMQAMAGADVLDGYEVRGHDDLRVGVMPEQAVPAWVRRRLVDRLPGPTDHVTTFSVGWQPADVVQLDAEQPTHAFRVMREGARPRVRATARAIADATGGVVTDADGFEVGPPGG